MALAIGPLVGGLLTEHVNWNWIFFINVPVGLLGLLAIPLFIDESRDSSSDQRLDVPGLAVSALGLFSLTYAFIEANSYGWSSPRIVGAFAVAAVSGISFVLLERHQRAPMLDLSLFRNRTFGGAITSMLFVGLAMFGTFFYVSLYMQNVLGYTPVEAGASFLPMTILIILIAPRAGALTDRIGSRWLVGAGMTLLSLMLFYFTMLGVSESFWALLPGLLLGGFGMGLTMTPITAAAMSAVAVDKAGVGSAVLNSARQVGGSLGIAVMGAIVASGSDFLTGFHDALRVASVLCLAGAAVAVLAIRKIEHKRPAADALAEAASA
jgi:EmrB/QacA subfamily drug resistance transporter